MKEASYYISLKANDAAIKDKDKNSKNPEKLVQCKLCPRMCVIKPGGFGKCGVRENLDGKLHSIVYGRPCTIHIDPVEKKPLYHFLPGSRTLSIATIGCNLSCSFCQNWQISQARARNIDEEFEEVTPARIVELCKENKCESISYTYTEPTIFYEYMLDIAKLAKKAGIRNIIVSNGFISEAPLLELCEYIDAANIDLKAFTDEFYRRVCGGTAGSLEDVKRSLKIYKDANIELEITNLVIPRQNDNMKKIEEMCAWIRDSLGADTPLHFSRFHSDHNMTDVSDTPIETLERAKKAAQKYLDFVYVGNVEGESNTFCPKCDALLVRRSGMRAIENRIILSPEKGKIKSKRTGTCPGCGAEIAGIWK